MSHHRQPVKYQTACGFTLIEIMVAVSIFAIVATIAVSALLSANAVNQRAQAIKLAVDNVNYAIDSMAIKLKRGTSFGPTTPNSDTLTFTSPKQALPPPNPQPQNYTYQRQVDANNRGYIMMTVGSNSVRITSPDVDIQDLKFNVLGVPAWGRVTIVIRGNATVGHSSSAFALQTTVSER